MELNRAQLGNDGIVYVEPIGDQTYETALELEKLVAGIVDKLREGNAAVHIYIDFGKMGIHTSEARRAAFDFFNSMYFDKLALTCQGLLLKYVAIYMVKASQKELPIRYVENKEEAVRWFSERMQ